MNGNIIQKRTIKNWDIRLLCIALILILIGSIGAYFIQTDGNKIEVIGIKIPTENGQWVKADLFKPKTATDTNPAPMVVVIPGFSRTKETQISNSIELARRGIVTLTIDPYNQGDSSTTLSEDSVREEGYGAIPIIKYITETNVFNYVDKERIGVTGHSAGGNAALQVAAYFGEEANRDKKPSKISSAFIVGYDLSLTNKTLRNIDSNLGLSYGYYDEGSYRNQNHNAHMKNSPEALEMVNSIFSESDKISSVEIGKMYGAPDNRTLRVVYNEKIDHIFQPYDTSDVSDMLKFFTTSFHINNTLMPTNQIWFIKEIFSLIALVGAFLFIVPFAGILLRTKIFSSLVENIPKPILYTKKEKMIFAGTFIAAILIAFISYNSIPKISYLLFRNASKGINTLWFPEEANNPILLWTLFNGIVGLIIFAFTYKLHWKKNEMWNIKIDLKKLVKTIVLAICIFSAFYGLVEITYKFFHTDFRFVLMAVRPINTTILLVSLMYLPFFFIFFLHNSIRVNYSSRFSGQKEWISMLICALENCAGLLMVLIIQYVHLAATGKVFWTTNWLFVGQLFSFVPLMFILPYFNRYFFRKTGKPYLGAMVTCLIVVMVMLNNSIIHVPL